MKKKNSIILMFVVLITMFINVNSVMAKKLDCTYKVTDTGTKIVPKVDTKKKKIYLTERDNCLFYLKDTTNYSKIDTCKKKPNKKKTFEYDYNPDCLNFDPEFMFRPFIINGTTYYNSSDCPAQLCAKANDKNEDKDATKGNSSLCWYDVNGNKDFNITLPASGKKSTFTVTADMSCYLELDSKSTDAEKKACAKKKGNYVSYDFDPDCKEQGAKKYNIIEGNGNGKNCPKQLCLRKSDTARALKFSTSKGCALWGSLLPTLKSILTLIKWFMGVGLIIMTMLDFTKVVSSSDPEQALGKAKKKLVTRIIVLILVFLVPSILDFLINNVLDVKTCIDSIQ